MTIDEIIEGLKFTVDMFMLNPLTGENLTKLDLNPYNRRAVEACSGAIKAITELKAKLEKPIQFRVIDTTTGKEPTEEVIFQLAKQGNLVYCDIDGFYIGEDGEICLMDDCGNATWLDVERFKVEVLR
jgi:hypothetical protein